MSWCIAEHREAPERLLSLFRAATHQATYDLMTRHRLLGLPRQGGGMAFPAFQFSADSGRPYDGVPTTLSEFAAAEVDAYAVGRTLPSCLTPPVLTV